MSTTDLSRNLRLLCSYEKSVSVVCRAIDINRQQFNKYLNGVSKPSPNNLRRICSFFQIQMADIHLQPDEFARRVQHLDGNKQQDLEARFRNTLHGAFSGNTRNLRRYLGYYMLHMHSITWPGYLYRGLSRLYEQDGMIQSKTIDRVKDPVGGNLYLSKYDGYVSLLGDKIFIIEYESLAEDSIGETILYPIGRSQLTYLDGVTFGLSNKTRNPHVSKTVWKYLGRTIDLRQTISSIGITPVSSKINDPQIIRMFGDKPFPNELIHRTT